MPLNTGTGNATIAGYWHLRHRRRTLTIMPPSGGASTNAIHFTPMPLTLTVPSYPAFSTGQGAVSVPGPYHSLLSARMEAVWVTDATDALGGAESFTSLVPEFFEYTNYRLILLRRSVACLVRGANVHGNVLMMLISAAPWPCRQSFRSSYCGQLAGGSWNHGANKFG